MSLFIFGKRMEAFLLVYSTQIIKCPKCGASNLRDKKICKKCGAVLEPNKAVNNQSSAAEQ
ncbi:zinc-ribbon domain-containing protein [Desulfitobacterium sp. AusDCA]|uniref:zinc-ribbon domain-containing protein n=1 Tax=Desulfitobacterium sp. AusDCA TaxID=3240383 RepID=UPI003DA6E215